MKESAGWWGVVAIAAIGSRNGRQAMVWKSTDMAGLWDEVTTINYKDPVAQWPSGVVSVVWPGEGWRTIFHGWTSARNPSRKDRNQVSGLEIGLLIQSSFRTPCVFFWRWLSFKSCPTSSIIILRPWSENLYWTLDGTTGYNWCISRTFATQLPSLPVGQRLLWPERRLFKKLSAVAGKRLWWA